MVHFVRTLDSLFLFPNFSYCFVIVLYLLNFSFVGHERLVGCQREVEAITTVLVLFTMLGFIWSGNFFWRLESNGKIPATCW